MAETILSIIGGLITTVVGYYLIEYIKKRQIKKKEEKEKKHSVSKDLRYKTIYDEKTKQHKKYVIADDETMKMLSHTDAEMYFPELCPCGSGLYYQDCHGKRK